MSTASALQNLRLRLRAGGTLVINALGSDTHMDAVRAAMSATFHSSTDLVRSLHTSEGNTVFVGVHASPLLSSGSAAQDVDEQHQQSATRGEPLGWADACVSLGFVEERL